MKKIPSLHLPPNIVVRPAPLGQQDFMHQALVGIGTSMIISVILVYLLMVALYNDYLSPFIIIFSVPVAAIGAIGALVLTHRTLNLFSLIGTILLIGIATKNGILLVDYANTLRNARQEQGRRDHGERAHPVPADHHDQLLGRCREHSACPRARSGLDFPLEPRHRGHRRCTQLARADAASDSQRLYVGRTVGRRSFGTANTSTNNPAHRNSLRRTRRFDRSSAGRAVYIRPVADCGNKREVLR